MAHREAVLITIPEAVNTAIYNEKLACERYRDIAEFLYKADNKDAGDFFIDQSNRELGHYNSLIKFRDKRHIKEGVPALGESLRWLTPEGGSGVEIRADMNLHDALILVEEMESGAEKFYRDMAEKAEDLDAKELFTKLAVDESHHHYLARKLQAIYELKGKIEPVDFDDLGFE